MRYEILTSLTPASILRVWPSESISVALESPWCTPGAVVTPKLYSVHIFSSDMFSGVSFTWTCRYSTEILSQRECTCCCRLQDSPAAKSQVLSNKYISNIITSLTTLDFL